MSGDVRPLIFPGFPLFRLRSAQSATPARGRNRGDPYVSSGGRRGESLRCHGAACKLFCVVLPAQGSIGGVFRLASRA